MSAPGKASTAASTGAGHLSIVGVAVPLAVFKGRPASQASSSWIRPLEARSAGARLVDLLWRRHRPTCSISVGEVFDHGKEQEGLSDQCEGCDIERGQQTV